jgi:transposase
MAQEAHLELFKLALGLADPWQVTRTDFDPDSSRLDLYLDFARGSRFACPECKEADCQVHDTEDKTWRHLDFFQHQAYLHARVPRVRCSAHGVRLVDVPWARQGSGFTLLFEALLLQFSIVMPVAAVEKMTRENDTRIWRVLERWCYGAKRSRLQPLKDVVKMIESHKDGILAWHVNRATNGLLEGTNSLIQAAKARARGYRNKRYMITVVYLIAGKLPLPTLSRPLSVAHTM